jgi:nucleoside-diphosphate-sugar epimerase
MRVLVTGAAGFIGSHLSEALIAGGHDVVGLDAFIPYYPRPLKERNLAGLRGAPGFTFHEVDLRTAPIEPLIDGVDAVVHLAAMPGLVRSWTDFDLYLTCNVAATSRLLDACRARDVPRFIHISTSSVYGLDAIGDEDMPTTPVSPYGVTKLAAEHLVMAYVQNFGFPAAILRYFSIYGPRQRPDMAYQIFTEALSEGRPITVFGDGEQSRSSTFVTDAVAGTIAAISGASVGGIYNIAGGRRITLNQAIATIADELGVTPAIERGPARGGDQRHTEADTTRARDTFGYRATVDPEDGLREQVRWFVRGRTPTRP